MLPPLDSESLTSELLNLQQFSDNITGNPQGFRHRVPLSNQALSGL